jgi:hypothetical protein
MNTESRTAKNINATVNLTRDEAVARGFVKRQANGYFSTIGNKPVTGDIVAVKQATGEVV